MNWRSVETKAAQYFALENGRHCAIYTTKQGQEELIAGLEPVFLKQVHSNIIIDIDADQTRTGDGLVTARGACIGLRVADCLPVYFFSGRRACVIHCGWRGIAQGIAREAKRLLPGFSYALGACIGPCCYEVKHDVRDVFTRDYPDAVRSHGGKYFLDLKAAVIRDLGAGAMIADLDRCTKCHPEHFYSHRLGDSQRNYALVARGETH